MAAKSPYALASQKSSGSVRARDAFVSCAAHPARNSHTLRALLHTSQHHIHSRDAAPLAERPPQKWRIKRREQQEWRDAEWQRNRPIAAAGAEWYRRAKAAAARLVVVPAAA